MQAAAGKDVVEREHDQQSQKRERHEVPLLAPEDRPSRDARQRWRDEAAARTLFHRAVAASLRTA
jgi:hypothetical protein